MRTPKQLWDEGACTACRHYQVKGCRCAAFPRGIPIEVASGQLAHFGSLPDDHGIHFEPRPETMESR